MLKKLITSSVLAVCCSFAQAAEVPSEWSFTWTGFNSWGMFRPDLSYTGTFTGVDANHNGTIERSELTTFGIDGNKILNCPSGPFSAECHLDSFSYAIGGKLEFSAIRMETHESGESYPMEITYSYDSGYGVGYEYRQGMYSDYGTYNVTPQTVMAVRQTLAPVPEPEAYAMLGAGLLMLAGLRSRKKKQ